MGLQSSTLVAGGIWVAVGALYVVAKTKALGHPVTMMDVGHAIVFMPAASLGVTGYETKPELDGNSDLLARIESIRLDRNVAE